MSTRATYRFDNKHAQTATIYIHHDGYPDGAASYLYNALIRPSHGCMATQMIRANERAELTTGHDAHGDTEYRYSISGKGPDAKIKAYKLVDSFTSPKWAMIYSGPLRSFVERHTRYLEDFTPFQLVDVGGSKQWLNLTTAGLYLVSEYGPLHHLRVWSKSRVFEGNEAQSGNWQSQVKTLAALVEAFPELQSEEIAGFLASLEVVL